MNLMVYKRKEILQLEALSLKFQNDGGNNNSNYELENWEPVAKCH